MLVVLVKRFQLAELSAKRLKMAVFEIRILLKTKQFLCTGQKNGLLSCEHHKVVSYPRLSGLKAYFMEKR